MLFNSVEFLWFLPLIVVLYYSIPHRYRWLLLLAGSYYFYSCWNVWFLGLILLSTAVDYVAAIQIFDASDTSVRKRWMWFSVAVNMGVLFTFKYFNFFIGSAQDALVALGLDVPRLYLNVILPVGISFYSFQTMSYTIDVYRKEWQPERHLGRFALFVAFFPQLVAGPIERASQLLPQFLTRVNLNLTDVQVGLNRIAYGFFKKIVIADRLGEYVNQVFAADAPGKPIQIAIGSVFFAIQLYGDFSGYSDIAIGSARLLGIRLMDNFDRPYLVSSLRSYWRKWHISLSIWVRDYVYKSLGGSRGSVWRVSLNLIVSFALVGLWHGDNWNFLVFGAAHGLYMAIERLLRPFSAKIPGLLRHTGGAIITLTFILLGLLMFRANSVAQGFELYERLFAQPWAFDSQTIYAGQSHYEFVFSLLLIGLLALSYLLPKKLHFGGKYGSALNLLLLVVLTLLCIALNNYEQVEFYYFQF